jgi:hypothetical protein
LLDRSKAAALYSEPGGYYEVGLDFGKPVVACVVGRWKSKLTRAVGHAGAMAGAGDRAEDKERWFMDTFGVDALFTPERPVVSAKGAVVTSIAHIPAALTAVMKLNGIAPDFRARGSLALKPWIAFSLNSEKRASNAHMSPLGMLCFDIFSPPLGESEVISHVERPSSKEMKIAPISVWMALGASGRSDIACMVISRVGARNLTLPERRPLSTSPWDLLTQTF